MDFRSLSDFISVAISLFFLMAILLLIFIPLGIWKLIDIIIWLSTHIHITYALH